MNKRAILAASAVMLAAAAATTALAAVTLKTPRALVLQKSDLPRGAVAGQNYTVPGALATSYTVTFNFHNGPREEEVTSDVAVARNPGDATRVYQLTVAAGPGLKGTTLVRLPAYGDQQYADFFSGPNAGGAARARGELIVRKHDVVWTLTIENCGPYAPAGCLGSVTPPKMTKAQAIAELKKYALKQKARVGNG